MTAHDATPSGKPRARALGIPFRGTPGPYNAITDVAGVEVGYTTLLRGDGPLVVGHGPVRTGVTAILPRGRAKADVGVFAGGFSLNGNGEMTGTIWIEESGECGGPITITNTHSCGIARDATVRWVVTSFPSSAPRFSLPVAGETYDGVLNDINGFHVTEAHVLAAIDGATSGPIELGSVGGGTGMICYGFKGGSGSASRIVEAAGGRYLLGAFVQANFGARAELTIAGVPVGRHFPVDAEGESRPPGGSVIALVATDSPLLPHQLKRLARRVSLGVGRSGAVSHNGSGDIFLAVSTANEAALGVAPGAAAGPCAADFLPNDALDPLFAAVVEAVDEAVIDAMVANQAMSGRDGITIAALPHEALLAILASYNRTTSSRRATSNR